MLMLLRALLSAVLCAALAAPAAAKRIYKYQDENGVWHYTDQPPQTDQPVQSRVLDVDPEPKLTVREVGPPRQPEYAFFNELYGPIQVRVAKQGSKNMVSDPPLPATFVVPARSERRPLDLTARNPRAKWSVKLSVSYTPGDPAAQPDATLYRLPFPATEHFYISQAFDGDHTHSKAGSRYAVDIVMPMGTPVLAARSGVVMDVERDFHKTGTDKSYAARANLVRVLHDDGTMAVYAHLKLESIVVYPGDEVRAGDLLGYSGNTGYSTGPHLHFVVQRNAGMKLVSIPFQFAGAGGAPLTPRAGGLLGGS